MPDTPTTTPSASLFVSEQKAALRKTAQAARASAADRAGPNAAADLARHLADWVRSRDVRVVSGYLAIGSELDVTSALQGFARQGAEVALPVVIGAEQPLIFRRWQPGMALQAGPLGTRHPPDDSPVLVPDVLLVPMLAYDGDGYRLGWGGGFYDRTLADLRRQGPVSAVGIAYAAQRVDKVPRDDHDAGLDWIATEAGLTKVRR